MLNQAQAVQAIPQRETEINIAMGNLSNAVEILTDVLGRLGNRLEVVSSAPKDKKQPTLKGDSSKQTKLGNEIFVQVRRIDDLTEAVKEYIDRLEI